MPDGMLDIIQTFIIGAITVAIVSFVIIGMVWVRDNRPQWANLVAGLIAVVFAVVFGGLGILFVGYLVEVALGMRAR